MLVQNQTAVSSYQTKPSFKKLNSVKYAGLYNKTQNSGLGLKLVQAFKSNPNAMKFCKKYDVDLVFFAAKDRIIGAKSSIHMFFTDPSKKKFLGIFGNNKDKIELTQYAEAGCTVEESLKSATKDLVDFILGEKDGGKGVLDSHMRYKDEAIEQILSERASKHKAKDQERLQKIASNKMAEHHKMLLENATKELLEECQ